MLKTPIITLTTDFGLKDPFAGLMRGAILGINSDAKIVDITHNVQRHNIYEGSQTIAMSYKYFPPTSIHIVVVDPGVGSTRRPLLVVTEDYYFIGPDNGVFTPIYEELKSHFFKIYHLTASHYFLPMSGATFHGRDIFAPVAAWLSKGVNSDKLGDPIEDYVTIPLTRPEISGNAITGQIVSIDNFGNAISNIKREHLESLASSESTNNFTVMYDKQEVPFVTYYADNRSGTLAAIINSFGHLELFLNMKSAAETLNVKIGDTITAGLASRA